MAERKFSKSLGKPGMAAHVRETVSHVVRTSSVQSKTKQVTPIDYEDFVMKNKTLIQNDPLRELLLYPSDDVTQVVLPRRYRTTTHNIPLAAETNQCSLLVKASLRSYSSNWNLIHYKFSAYSGSYLDLPKLPKSEELKEEIYEVDTDGDQVEDSSLTKLDGITKEGFLLKGPDVSSDRYFVNLGSKSFKRRYCCLRQQVDGSYILEVHKDDKKGEAKVTVDMLFCVEVSKNLRRGRNCFELKMTGHKSFTFATENDADLTDWMNTLQQVLQHNRAQEEKRSGSLERGSSGSVSSAQLYGTLKGLEQSVNPQLIKYGRETDASIALCRKENRKRLFSVYPHISHVKSSCDVTAEPSPEPYREQFGQRVLVQCESVKFRLQASVDDDTDGLLISQVEPYLCHVALYDTRQNRKLTESFHFDVNNERARAMIHRDNTIPVSKLLSAELSQVNEAWALHPSQAVMSVSSVHSDIFLVLRIDKVLQGPVAAAADPYIKCAKDPKLASRVHKTVKQCCQRLGKYRMPFAWTARPLFRQYNNELDTTSDFPAIFRQEPNRLKDEEILKILSEYRKPEKINKLVTIPGWAKIRLGPVTELPENSLTTALVPLKPFPIPPTQPPTVEVAELETGSAETHPYTTFNNHLYVYPHSLLFDAQKNFSRARNLACLVELRDSDQEGAAPLYCMYGRPGEPLLTQRIVGTVLHHNTCPVWNDEVKLRLPIHLHSKHHLLFTFYHVSCEVNKKKDVPVESCVGYSWLPLLQKGRLVVDDQQLAVAAHLPPGYLNIQPFGLDKGNAPPEVTWVDNQRQIFSVGLELVSTVMTRDLHLHNLFTHLERLLDKSAAIPPSESETCKILKASHAMHLATCITFLPTILNELFKVLLVSQSEEVGLNLVRVLIHLIHVVHEAGRQDILQSYIKFVFCAVTLPGVKTTVHEELAARLTALVATATTDFLIVSKFMKHSSFFFQIMSKSMVQHLLSSGRIKMHRNERFSSDFLERVEKLMEVVVPLVVSRRKDSEQIRESHLLNKSLAHFLSRCLSVMDRGYVFKLIALYIHSFSATEGKATAELKFAFLQIITSHEHYVAFNLPVQTVKMRPSRSNGDSPVHELNLTEEFRKQHYLAGLLLEEVKGALLEAPFVRRLAVATLRDLLAKHELDDRYQSRGQLTRIASLYMPWVSVVLDNVARLSGARESVIRHSRISSSSSMMPCNSSIVSKPFQRFTDAPSSRASVCLKDSHLFAVIAGQGALTNGTSDVSLESLESANDAASTVSQETAIIREVDADSVRFGDTPVHPTHHVRSVSGVTALSTGRSVEKFQLAEIKDILLCFLFVVKYVGEETLISWWQRAHSHILTQFFTVIEICLHQFKYLGKKKIVGKVAAVKPVKAMTLPARMQPPDFNKGDGVPMGSPGGNPQGSNSVGRDGQLPDNESAKLYQALLEANMATEVGLLALDAMGLYAIHLQDNLLAHNGDNPLMAKVFDIYLSFLQVGQSETLFRHVFAALRAFINNFSVALFKGNASMCGRLCGELLRCCNSRLSTVRQESCSILYLLMRSNFEFTNRKGLNRVHLQVIISVSHMLGNAGVLNNVRFQESLSLINSYATSDKVMKGTGFPGEVKDLTKRIRTVLMATAQMREHSEDPEMLVDLQHSLANSYASTPELRHTWLLSMIRNHIRDGNYSEAMCCQLHIAALIAEYLKLKKVQSWGADAFNDLSRNITKDETGLKLDSGVQDVQYTEATLYEELDTCVSLIEKAERWELLASLYQLMIPMQLKCRNYHLLSQYHLNLSQAYVKIADGNKAGRRLLGRYYRIAFFGQAYFEEDSGNEYVYKEPKLTALAEISERLQNLFSSKFGREVVKIIMDSNQVDASQLDSKYAYIQVTSVTPYTPPEAPPDRLTEFEVHYDVDSFMFETPFTRDGRARADPHEQCKRRTVLHTEYKFPYVSKRIRVIKREVTELSPIEVALDEMRHRLAELEEVVHTMPTDAKKLQLRLQGSVCVQVNAGPLAYANAFLDPARPNVYSDIHVEALKEIFMDFVKICWSALQVNGTVIESDQREYQDVLTSNFRKMCAELSALLGEPVCPEADEKRHSQVAFSVVTGGSHSSSSA